MIHCKLKNPPVRIIIIWDMSAQSLSENKLSKFDKILKPPTKVKNPKRTTICINNFLLFGNVLARIENASIKIPKNEGIREVIELLPLTYETIKPHRIKKMP